MTEVETRPLECERELSWAVLGASGFVGSGILAALDKVDTRQVRPIRAPRLQTSAVLDTVSALEMIRNDSNVQGVVADLVRKFEGIDVVVNAAGIATPDASNENSLMGANGLLPVIIAEAAKRARVGKLIHISSAAVQGNRKILDESPDVEPFSPYSRSKALGEQALASWIGGAKGQSNDGQLRVVTIRATSVQGPGRRTTISLKRIARSPLASVAKPGDQPSVVSSLDGLSRFVVTVGASSQHLPLTLIQPWEGASVRDVLLLAGGGRNPKFIPDPIARAGVKSLKIMGKLNGRFKGLARRLEVMWFGQSQVSGWAVQNGLVEKIEHKPAETLRRALL